MKIAYLAAGAGGMYCGACLHDNTLAAALLRSGEDVLLIPTYTPIRTDEADVSLRRVFFGGINVYLQEKWSFFRRRLGPLDRLLDSPAVLRWATGRSVSVDPRQLGSLAVSILQGEHGKLRKELHRLADWLADEVRPDVVHLSNAMLIAMAPEIVRRTGAAVVCGLAGEDVFLERVPEPYYSRARRLMVQHARAAAGFVALNRYYADYMTQYMQLDPAKVHVIPHGLHLEGHGTRQHAAGNRHVTIGYLARVCPDKGLHYLVDAFRLLCQEEGLPELRLKAAGYLADEDRPYLAQQQRKLQDWGLGERFEYAGELDRAEKIAFLQSLDVMSVPTVYRESKGLSVLEAIANAVPVVQPAHGAFPEMIADTGGGLLCRPDDPASLAAELRKLIVDPAAAAALGRAGQQAVHERYNAAAMARQSLELYRLVRQPAAETRTIFSASGALPDVAHQ